MKLLIIRHGDPDYSCDNLTSQGKDEARALAQYLKGYEIARIYSSPLGRAQETAQVSGKECGLPITIEQWSAELTLSISRLNLSAWNVHAYLLGENRIDTNCLRQQMNEEEFSDLHLELKRIQSESDLFFEKHGFQRNGGDYKIIKPNQECIAFFCHGGFGLTWLSQLLCIPVAAMWSGFFLATSSITEILFDERTSGIATPRCICLGSLPHLAMEGIPVGRSGLISNYK